MDKIEKFFRKLTKKERMILTNLIEQIISRDWHNLNLRKLRGYADVYRVRLGDFRVIFQDQKNDIKIIALERRNESTYKDI